MADKILSQYPDHVPVLVLPSRRSDPKISRSHFIVTKEFTLAQFSLNLRKYITGLTSESALYYFVGESMKTMPMISESLESLYNQHKSKDGYLYLFYTGENAFG
jgi:GABA(A) receptor-associated protein